MDLCAQSNTAERLYKSKTENGAFTLSTWKLSMVMIGASSGALMRSKEQWVDGKALKVGVDKYSREFYCKEKKGEKKY